MDPLDRLRLRLLEARARYRSAGGREGVADAVLAVLDFLDETFVVEVEDETPDSDLESALQPVRALVIALRHPGPHSMRPFGGSVGSGALHTRCAGTDPSILLGVAGRPPARLA